MWRSCHLKMKKLGHPNFKFSFTTGRPDVPAFRRKSRWDSLDWRTAGSTRQRQALPHPRQRVDPPARKLDASPRWTRQEAPVPAPVATNLQRPARILCCMRIRSGRSRTPATSRARKPDDLLGIWLDLLKRFDDAPRRRGRKTPANPAGAAQHPDADPPVIGPRSPSLGGPTTGPRRSDRCVEAVLLRPQFGKQALNFQA
jgi:hypothetical protein